MALTGMLALMLMSMSLPGFGSCSALISRCYMTASLRMSCTMLFVWLLRFNPTGVTFEYTSAVA